MAIHKKQLYIIFLTSLLLQFNIPKLHAQQSYINNHQLACNDDTYNSTTKGYLCDGGGSNVSSCRSYLTFRSQPPYNTPESISKLLNSSSGFGIASLNNISSVSETIPTNVQVIVPITCSCSGSGSYYQHNASYTLLERVNMAETYFSVANDTYQGLSTCQALMSQNPYGEKDLVLNMKLLVPLRCACPSSNQVANGIKYLLTYMVTWGDSVSAIADTFGVNQSRVLEGNEMKVQDLIFPFTPLLIPLTNEPIKIQTKPVSPPPPPQGIIPTTVPSSGSNNSDKWIFIGAGIGSAFLVLAVVSGFVFCFYRRRSEKKNKPKLPNVSDLGTKLPSDSADYEAMKDKSMKLHPWFDSVSSDGVRYAIESLTLYKFEDLRTATGDFSEGNKIKSSVYLGLFNGDNAAVKMMKGDVTGEINILKMINHSNIVRLSGFCVHQGNTYLVYEYADNGSVSDCLHSKKHQTLSWKQRVQIGRDVADAVNYLHNYTNPPYIHKNLKSSNILLDENNRAKVTNFGLARSVEINEQEGNVQLTRHVVGTQGYMAPEYIENGVITPKLDVFAFGVVILELLSGKEAASGDKSERDELLHTSISKILQGDDVRGKLRGFIDPSLRNEYPLDIAFSLAQLAETCVAYDINARPSMAEILMAMSKILSSTLDWDPSDELERSRSVASS